MEVLGFKSNMKQLLQDWCLPVGSIITDRHIQLRAYMRENYSEKRRNKENPHITHYLNIWHVAKS